MLEIPVVKDTDAEDVVWGLQTADTLWRRGERIDALVWLRRAAQAAGDANDDDRALELARYAAELTEFMNREEAAAGERADHAENEDQEDTHVVPGRVVPSLSEETEIEAEHTMELDSAELEPGSIPPPKPPPPPPRTRKPPPPPPVRRPSQAADALSQASAPPAAEAAAPPAAEAAATELPPPGEPAPGAPAEEEPIRPSLGSVPPAEKVHAGMFDPWADTAAAGGPVPRAIPVAPVPDLPKLDVEAAHGSAEVSEEEVITSVRSHAPSVPGSEPPISTRLPVPQPPGTSRTPTPLQPPPPPPRARSVPAIPLPLAVEPQPEHEPDVEAPSESTVEGATPVSPAAAPLDLDDVDAFADLPDDARTAFAAAATIHTLAEGDEIGTFALAYVLSGTFDVAATVVDAPAVRLSAGAVLRSRGTTAVGIPMRLISAQGEGVVATWSDEAVEAAFRTIPWVDEDLRAAADRVQTLVGITIGPLGERLDMSIRELIMSRLTMKPLAPSEVVVPAGEAVPGLLLVGVGELELVKDDEVTGVVSSGDFLFPTEVLGAGSAPATARAGAGGALVMFGDRAIAQELLVTCPPLLEVFAGM